MSELVEQAPEEAVPAPAGPVPSMRGVFSLYDTPGGGYHIAFRAQGADEDGHFEVPAMLVVLAREAQASGEMPSPAKIFKAVAGMGRHKNKGEKGGE